MLFWQKVHENRGIVPIAIKASQGIVVLHECTLSVPLLFYNQHRLTNVKCRSNRVTYSKKSNIKTSIFEVDQKCIPVNLQIVSHLKSLPTHLVVPGCG